MPKPHLGPGLFAASMQPRAARVLTGAGRRGGGREKKDHNLHSGKMIPAGGTAEEVWRAVNPKDFTRLQAFFITEADMKALNLPAGDMTRIRDLQKQADSK